MAHWRAVCLTLTVNVVSPIVIYSISSKEMSQANALLLSGIPPAVFTAVTVVRHRRMDFLAGLTLVSISLSAVLAALTQDPQLMLVKDSIFTCVIGASFLTSTCCGKEDLIWQQQREYRGAEAKEHLDAMYAKPEIKARSRRVCQMWGVGLFIEAAIRIVLIYTTSVDVVAYASPVLLVLFFAILGVWTKCYMGNIFGATTEELASYESATKRTAQDSGHFNPLMTLARSSESSSHSLR
ncbi:unnamed protein product [Aphanomyces euteiches]